MNNMGLKSHARTYANSTTESMTIRAYIATKLMAAMMAHPERWLDHTMPLDATIRAVRWADQLITALNTPIDEYGDFINTDIEE
jgi:hypothetical protein